ncbi:hypothetical protein LTR28_005734, partial [Elasticomyces elasticus]
DTERVKSATAVLNKQYYKNPDSLTALLHILVSHQNAGLRQLAAVEARKLVSRHWASISETVKPQIRQSLLQSTIKSTLKMGSGLIYQHFYSRRRPAKSPGTGR